MGFLFDMLDKASGLSCQATNFLKTFSNKSKGEIISNLYRVRVELMFPHSGKVGSSGGAFYCEAPLYNDTGDQLLPSGADFR